MYEIDIYQLVARSTWVIKIDLGVLLVMSVASWSLIVFKTLQFLRQKRAVSLDLKALRDAPDIKTAVSLVYRGPASLAGSVAAEAVKELQRLEHLEGDPQERVHLMLDDLRYVLDREVRSKTDELYGTMSFLAACATAAPLLGLFGTVWGIMHTFHSVGLSRASQLDVIAPGLAEALSTTALGLIVAIPATLAYNWLLRRLSLVENELNKFSATLLNRIKIEPPASQGIPGSGPHE